MELGSRRAHDRDMRSPTGSDRTMERQRYDAAWRSLRLRRWAVWGLLLACIVVGRISGWNKDVPRYVLEAAFGLTIAALLWSAAFRCPRCRKLFRWSRTNFNPLTQRCAHCQLPVGAKPD